MYQQVKAIITIITFGAGGLGSGWSQMVGVLRHIRGGSGLISEPRDVAIVPSSLRFSTSRHGQVRFRTFFADFYIFLDSTERTLQCTCSMREVTGSRSVVAPGLLHRTF